MNTKKKILIVEDERLNIKILLETLKAEYKTLVAINGEEGLGRALSKPDLILLDIMMPGIDGYEVCRRLKADEQTKDIPVIFITAMSDVGYEKKGLELGAVDYITKPISPPIVKARVKHHLERENYRKHLEIQVKELQDAMSKIKTLSGFLPICANCKKIRDDKGYWNQIEEYIQSHSEADFTHSICPDCAKKLYPEIHVR